MNILMLRNVDTKSSVNNFNIEKIGKRAQVPVDVASQLAGSTLAAQTLVLIFHVQVNIDVTVTQFVDPTNVYEAFAWEFILSFILMLTICGVATDIRAGLDASFNADGDGNGDEDNEDQENDDKDNDDLVLLLPLSISGLLLFGFAISHRAEFHRLGLCVTVSLHHSNGNVVSVWVCA
ncbi:hypothetical protein LWI29_036136 [Acer saccharum]|uniref:Uncharacterized protein n=1 Tax=Acer saccharum TaxID=4024 RepID=A0AA39TIQ2_ACESA|nr:hypothetical protein LWI29_036136 [Acer saccharum]